MKKFFKEIFSSENLKKAMVYGALANPSISSSEIIHLSNILRDMNSENVNSNINKEVQIKKVA